MQIAEKRANAFGSEPMVRRDVSDYDRFRMLA
jgi:hypothetical protein